MLVWATLAEASQAASETPNDATAIVSGQVVRIVTTVTSGFLAG